MTLIAAVEAGHTVTFLLRNTSVFDNDVDVQQYIKSSKAHLVKGDALVREDVQKGWEAAASNSSSGTSVCCEIYLFHLPLNSQKPGGIPKFHVVKGFVISPPNLVTQSLLNALSTLPTPRPRIITISSTGLTRTSHAALPLLLKPLYGYLLASPHRDKVGAERVVSHVAGWTWNSKEYGEPVAEVLDVEGQWRTLDGLPAEGTLKEDVLVIRPALLTDGECLAETGKQKYRVSEEELGGWTVSRKDVAHFVADASLNRWDEFKGKCVSIAY
ncbi:hypothetical protein DXG03_008358 [Asterophora parasitica]|uniref:NAD(P)-binding domain-containing protein n=1 Tax=Asterophora parasitica TaxID=117018 RepID=A0A9P7KBE8_9AGAR|nr:hypothetical protein DXG03_008358 [Asterophora parasitica]